MNLEIKDKMGRKYLHKEFRFTVPEIADAIQQGYMDDRYLHYLSRNDSWWKSQMENGEVSMQMKVKFDTHTGAFSFSLGKLANNMEKLVAMGRKNK
jgi:hypothetical protein